MKEVSVLLAMIALSAVSAGAQDVVPPEAHQWEVHNTNTLNFGVDYELYNQKNQKQLGYEDTRGPDVDLGWVGHSGGHFNFMRKAPDNIRDHRTGPIPENADVAIYNTKSRRYVKYQKFDDTRAELIWSTTPAYEWQLQNQKVTTVPSFAVYNSRSKKYLVLKTKDSGINLGWFTDPPVVQSGSVTLSPQVVVQGWVPYLGSAPPFGTLKGVLLTVQNASETATLAFVKPGKSTADCGDPTAVVIVGPRKNITVEQMKTLYGSATPRFPVNFLACLAAPPAQPIGPTFLNITFKLDP